MTGSAAAARATAWRSTSGSLTATPPRSNCRISGRSAGIRNGRCRVRASTANSEATSSASTSVQPRGSDIHRALRIFELQLACIPEQFDTRRLARDAFERERLVARLEHVLVVLAVAFEFRDREEITHRFVRDRGD